MHGVPEAPAVVSFSAYREGVDLGAPELIIILLVVLIIFGGAKLPQLARSLGEAQRAFRRG
jgi:sec-independent protein translocase protein TatA